MGKGDGRCGKTAQKIRQMKTTNHSNLPEPLVRAVTFSNRDREGCDYTITELIRPPRIAALERHHADEIEEDAIDRLWALMGSAAHEVLRRSAKTGIIEERAIVEIDGFKIGGQLDYAVSDDTLWDYKLTSVWAAKDGAKPEWIQQLNCYRYMASKYGVVFTKMVIVALFRDWSKREAARNSDYPQQQAAVLEIPLWSDADVEKWLSERIAMHEAANKELPLCTDEDVWAKPEKWAVMKKGGKRALKLHDTEAAAKEHAANQSGLDIEYRAGERLRCESYCRVSQFCSQWKEFQSQHSMTP